MCKIWQRFIKFCSLVQRWILLLLYTISDGTEETKQIPGDRGFIELQDLKDGVRYLVRITTLMGSQESTPATITFNMGMFCLRDWAVSLLDGSGLGSLWGSAWWMPL